MSFGLRRRSLVAFSLVALSAVGVRPAGAQAPQGPAPRAALEQRFRERVGQLVQRRLQLTDEQATKLRATNQRFEGQRRDLLREERETRQGLRRELAGGGDAADQQQVARLLDGMLAIHRRRLDIAAAEQKELAGFLTPVQRAKYFALQDELRKRMEEMRKQRADGEAPAPLRRRARAQQPPE